MSRIALLFIIVFLLDVGNGYAQESVNTLVDRAYEKIDEGNVEEAFTVATQAVSVGPNNSRALTARGFIYHKKGEFELASNDLNKAIKLNPSNASALFYRASLLRDNNDYNLAIKDFTALIKLRPTSVKSYKGRAETYSLKGDYLLSIKDYTKAIALEASADSYEARGLNYYHIGKYESAIEDFVATLKSGNEEWQIYTNPGQTYINLIHCLVRLRDFQRASHYYNELVAQKLDNQPTESLKYFVLAATEDIPVKNYNMALSNLNKAIDESNIKTSSSENSFANILSLKGFVLENLGRLAEAREAYEQSLLLNKVQPEVTLALSLLTNKETIISRSDKIPPVIELISPEIARGLVIVSATEQTQIIGKAKDPSGIARVEVNGTEINAEEDGLFLTQLPLKAGDNEIAITAVDKLGNSSSAKFSITANQVKAVENAADIIIPVETSPVYHAILIGEEDYKDPKIADLENPVKDAKELGAILQSHYTFAAENIDTLFNKSREDIMQTIVQKCNSLRENDNLLIFYAGHGIAEKDQFGDVEGYWIPSSARSGLTASYISADDINKAIKRSRGKHILVVADACFSGSFTRGVGLGSSAGIEKQYAVQSRKVMASGNMEPVPDNSRFLYYLKKSLQSNSEKYMSAKKLFDSFYEAIINNSDTLPQYAAIKNAGDEGGEFIFIKK